MSCSTDDSNIFLQENPIFNQDDPQEDPAFNLDQIQGQWIRVGGNNPENNGMIVNVEDNQGTIIDAAESNFSEGSVK